MKQNKTLTITLSALAFLILSAGVTYAASEEGLKRFDNLSDEQKSVLEEARDLREQGDYEAARDLIQNSGIDFPRFERGHRLMENREEVKKAIEDGDYDTFVELTEDSPRNIEIDEDTFNKLVEAHSLRMEGDHEAARKIMEEIGFDRGHKAGKLHNR